MNFPPILSERKQAEKWEGEKSQWAEPVFTETSLDPLAEGQDNAHGLSDASLCVKVMMPPSKKGKAH